MAAQTNNNTAAPGQDREVSVAVPVVAIFRWMAPAPIVASRVQGRYGRAAPGKSRAPARAVPATARVQSRPGDSSVFRPDSKFAAK